MQYHHGRGSRDRRQCSLGTAQHGRVEGARDIGDRFRIPAADGARAAGGLRAHCPACGRIGFVLPEIAQPGQGGGSQCLVDGQQPVLRRQGDIRHGAQPILYAGEIVGAQSDGGDRFAVGGIQFLLQAGGCDRRVDRIENSRNSVRIGPGGELDQGDDLLGHQRRAVVVEYPRGQRRCHRVVGQRAGIEAGRDRGRTPPHRPVVTGFVGGSVRGVGPCIAGRPECPCGGESERRVMLGPIDRLHLDLYLLAEAVEQRRERGRGLRRVTGHRGGCGRVPVCERIGEGVHTAVEPVTGTVSGTGGGSENRGGDQGEQLRTGAHGADPTAVAAGHPAIYGRGAWCAETGRPPGKPT